MQSERPGVAGMASASSQTGCRSRCLRQDRSIFFFFFFYPARQSGNTGNFLTFLPSFPSLSSPPCPFAHSAVCVSIAASHQINLHLPQPPGRSITNFTSRLCLSVDGFEVCCEMCGWGKKNLFSVKKKNDNLSFFQSRFSVCRDGFALRSVTKRL